MANRYNKDRHPDELGNLDEAALAFVPERSVQTGQKNVLVSNIRKTLDRHVWRQQHPLVTNYGYGPYMNTNMPLNSITGNAAVDPEAMLSSVRSSGLTVPILKPLTRTEKADLQVLWKHLLDTEELNLNVANRSQIVSTLDGFNLAGAGHEDVDIPDGIRKRTTLGEHIYDLLDNNGYFKKKQDTVDTMSRGEIAGYFKDFPLLGKIQSVQNRLFMNTGVKSMRAGDLNSALNALKKVVIGGPSNISDATLKDHINNFNMYIDPFNKEMMKYSKTLTDGTDRQSIPFLSDGASFEDLKAALQNLKLYKTVKSRHLPTQAEKTEQLFRISRKLTERLYNKLSTPAYASLLKVIAPQGLDKYDGMVGVKNLTTNNINSNARHGDIDSGLDFEERFNSNLTDPFSSATNAFKIQPHGVELFKQIFKHDVRKGEANGDVFGIPSGESSARWMYAYKNNRYSPDPEESVRGVGIHSMDGAKALEEWASHGQNIDRFIMEREYEKNMRNIPKEMRGSSYRGRLNDVASRARKSMSAEEMQSWIGRVVFDKVDNMPSKIIGTVGDKFQIKPLYANLSRVNVKYNAKTFQEYFNSNIASGVSSSISKDYDDPLDNGVIASGKISDKIKALSNELLSGDWSSHDAMFGQQLPMVNRYLKSSAYMNQIGGRAGKEIMQETAQDVSELMVEFSHKWLHERPDIEDIGKMGWKDKKAISDEFEKDFQRMAPGALLKREQLSKADRFARAFGAIKTVDKNAMSVADIERVIANFRDIPRHRSAVGVLMGLNGSDRDELAAMLYRGNLGSIDAISENGEGHERDSHGDIASSAFDQPENAFISKETEAENYYRMEYHDWVTPEGWKKFNRIKDKHDELLQGASSRGESLINIAKLKRSKNVTSTMLAKVNEEQARIRKINAVQRSLADQIEMSKYLSESMLPAKVKSAQELALIADTLMHNPGLGSISYTRHGIDEDMSIASIGNGIVSLRDTNGKMIHLGPEFNMYPNQANVLNSSDLTSLYNFRGTIDHAQRLQKEVLPFLKNPNGPYNYIASMGDKAANPQSVLETMDIISKFKVGQKVVGLDIETTAGKGQLDRLTEIAAKEYEVIAGGRLRATKRSFTRFIKPEGQIIDFANGKMPAGVTLSDSEKLMMSGALDNVGGIDKLIEKGKNGQKVQDEFHKWLNPDAAILGHNVRFDLNYLNNIGYHIDNQLIVDTQATAILLGKHSTALEQLVKSDGSAAIQALHAASKHEGMTDVKATVDIYNNLAPEAVKKYLTDPRLNVGDYLVHFHGKRAATISDENTRGLVKVMGYSHDANGHTMHLMRMDTGDVYQLREKSKADLENALATSYYNVSDRKLADLAAINDSYVNDRAARTARKMTSDYDSAILYEKRMEALHTYSSIYDNTYADAEHGVQNLNVDNYQDQVVLDKLRLADSDAAGIMEGMNKSEFVGAKALDPWYVNEYSKAHMGLVHSLQEQVAAKEAGGVGLNKWGASKAYKAASDALAVKYPAKSAERAAEMWEQALQVTDGDKNYNIEFGRRQWSEAAIHRYLSDKIKKGSVDDVSGAKLRLMRSVVIPQLIKQGVDLETPSDSDMGYGDSRYAPEDASLINSENLEARISSLQRSAAEVNAAKLNNAALLRNSIQTTSVAIDNAQLGNRTIKYDDILAGRSGASAAFIADALNANNNTFVNAVSATQEAAEAAGNSDKYLIKPTSGILEALQNAPLRAAAENSGRYTVNSALGIDKVSDMVRNLMKRPWAKKVLPAALALPLSYLAFQMIRGDDLNMGKATPRSVAGTNLGEWMQTPDMRMLTGTAMMPGPQPTIQFPTAPRRGHYKISMTEQNPQKQTSENVNSAVSQSLTNSMPIPVNIKTSVTDNTNGMDATWWSRNILDAIF